MIRARREAHGSLNQRTPPEPATSPIAEEPAGTTPPIVLNNVGEGQPDIHNEYTNNQFLDTRGLPAPATGSRAGYILQRVADESKPFGTRVEVKGETAEIKLKAGS